MKELQEIVRRLRTGGGPWVLATLVSTIGSSYRRAGARALLGPYPTRSDHRFGSISGGCLEDDLVLRAAEVFRIGRAELALYDTTSENDLLWGVGLGCHGVVKVLLEPLPEQAPPWVDAAAEAFRGQGPITLATVFEPSSGAALGTRLMSDLPPSLDPGAVFQQQVSAPTALWVFGAGDDAGSLVKLAAALGWSVTVADPRPAYARPERFPDAAAVLAAPIDRLLQAAAAAAPQAAVIMTHHYVHDRPLLAGLIDAPLSYLGLLGPRQRAERLLSDIGRDASVLNGGSPRPLHAPVGLDLGADGADEVALSIVAEIKATLAHRDGRPLHHRRDPIHARHI